MKLQAARRMLFTGIRVVESNTSNVHSHVWMNDRRTHGEVAVDIVSHCLYLAQYQAAGRANRVCALYDHLVAAGILNDKMIVKV